MKILLRKKNGGEEIIINTDTLEAGEPERLEDSNGWDWTAWRID